MKKIKYKIRYKFPYVCYNAAYDEYIFLIAEHHLGFGAYGYSLTISGDKLLYFSYANDEKSKIPILYNVL